MTTQDDPMSKSEVILASQQRSIKNIDCKSWGTGVGNWLKILK